MKPLFGISILGATLSFLSAASYAQTPIAPLNTHNVKVVNTTIDPVPITGTVQNAETPPRQAVQTTVQMPFTQGNNDSQVSTGPIPGNVPAFYQVRGGA